METQTLSSDSKKKMAQIAFLGMTVLIFLYMMVIAVKNIRRYNAFKWEYKSAQESLTEELRLNKKYHRQLAEINTADFWELEAKEQLGYVRKGEVVYKLLPTTHKH